MKRLFLLYALLGMYHIARPQDGSQSVVNKLPDFIPPTPEASNMMKADQLTIGYVTGSPNISIPLGSLQTGSTLFPSHSTTPLQE
ncbi:MAG TPA: hypothetical protein VD996_08655 [Chitinophagaceae bacterium]|nr:hypothetical protein [Chitinophagaceae bacterium]